MNDPTALTLFISLLGAFGIKEVWSILKKRQSHKLSQQDKAESTKDKIQYSVIEELRKEVSELKAKIDTLILENIELREKLARMEERLTISAKNRVYKKKPPQENG